MELQKLTTYLQKNNYTKINEFIWKNVDGMHEDINRIEYENNYDFIHKKTFNFENMSYSKCFASYRKSEESGYTLDSSDCYQYDLINNTASQTCTVEEKTNTFHYSGTTVNFDYNTGQYYSDTKNIYCTSSAADMMDYKKEVDDIFKKAGFDLSVFK